MRSRSACCAVSEIADTLAVLHRRFCEPIVRARLAALGDARRCDLVDDGRNRGGVADDAARAGHVADGAEPYGRTERLLVVEPLDVVAARVKHPVALEHLALVRKVDRRQLEPL